ncbi:MAG: CDP-glucose 4,6-dehydratase [Desulfobacula sp.]|jgi:CDP-glucose 4,6-dehydratase|nr:CDP-glucose 4,6-dehydratase [Desulfobacula sp.]
MESMVTLTHLKEFYSGRRVLVTGNTGFKGGWLGLLLRELGAEVVGIALSVSDGKPMPYSEAGGDDRYLFVECNIRDYSHLESLFTAHRPELVFHLAAQALVPLSYEDPRGTFETNLMGTVNVLEAARTCSDVRGFVNITSDKCYKNRGWLWGYRENDRLGGDDPYSSSKACAELATHAYQTSFLDGSDGYALASARAGNVIGGGDWAPNRLVPDIVNSLMEGRVITLRNPTAERPWQHVLEPLLGYLMLGQRLAEKNSMLTSGWNFGPDPEEALPVAGFVERFLANWGGEHKWKAEPASFHEAQLLRLDCTKAKELLGWRPLLDIDKAIELTVAWYKTCIKEPDLVKEVTQEQIKEYFELLC